MTAMEVLEEVEGLLSELSDVDSNARSLDAEKDKAVKAIVDEFAPKIDPLTKRRDEIMEKLAELYVEHEEVLTSGHGKQAVFRHGTIASRKAPVSVEVEEGAEGRAIDYLRKQKRLTMFTRQPKRTLNKSALKREPKFAAKIPGVNLVQAENLTVRLARTQVELVRNLSPFRKRIN